MKTLTALKYRTPSAWHLQVTEQELTFLLTDFHHI